MKKGLRIFMTIVILICLAVCTAAGVVGYTYRNGLQMQLNGERTLTQEFSEPFTDPGATCVFDGIFGEPKMVDVTVSGTVDTEKLGTYQLTYTAQYELDFGVFSLTCHATDICNVVVVDTKAPEIVLITNPDYYTLPGGTYEEEGFTARDNHDGDITALVERTQTQDQVTYRVTDASGNCAQVVRQIEYNDPIAPEITLLGEAHIMLKQNTTYKEAGFAALDNCDGDLTEKVTVSGEVDTGKAGTYVLTYTVEDSYGNLATAQRTVFVSAQPPVPGVPHTQYETPLPSNGKVIYLTFDDGPSTHTTKLLDILDRYGVKATFFVVYAGNAPVLQRMAESGHTVAIHSATHNYAQIYSSKEAYWNDLHIVQQKIQAATGIYSTIVRFPGGSSNTVSKQYCPGIMTELTQELADRGYRYFDWHVDSKDAAGAKTRDEIYYNVVSGIAQRKNASSTVVLQHDTTAQSVEAAEMIIQWGIANGYTFQALTMESPGCHHGVKN